MDDPSGRSEEDVATPASSSSSEEEAGAVRHENGTVVCISDTSQPTTTVTSDTICRKSFNQAVTFFKDGLKRRLIDHRVDPRSLAIYNNFFHTRYRSIPLSISLIVLLILPFFEYPSSLSLSSDVRRAPISERPQPFCGVTEAVELVALLLLGVDCALKFYLSGTKRFLKKPWHVAYAVFLILSYIDIWVSPVFCAIEGQASIAATVRIRRYFRPIFIIIRARTMKKFIKAIFKTVVAISTLLLIMVVILFLFTMIGLLLFRVPNFRIVMNTNSSDTANLPNHFSSVGESFINLIIFLTTSNSPDIMVRSYSENRFSFLYFSSFLTLALFIMLSLVTAMIYAEFRGYLLHSMQHSLLRSRVGSRAAFAVLQRESGSNRPDKSLIRELLEHGNFKKYLLQKLNEKLDQVTASDNSVGWHEFFQVLLVIDTHDPYEILDLIAAEKKQKILEKKKEAEHKQSIELEQMSLEKPGDVCTKRKLKLPFTLPPIALQAVLVLKHHPHSIVKFISSCVIITNAVFLAIILEIDFDSLASTEKFTIEQWPVIVFWSWYSFEFCFELTYIIILRTKHRRQFQRRNKWCLVSLRIFDLSLLFSYISLTLVIYVFNFMHYWHNRQEVYFTLVQISCIVILLRLLHITTFFPVASTLLRTAFDIVRIMVPLLGLIVVIFYEFSLLGMSLFGTNYRLDNVTSSRISECGTYENLRYNSFNFHDFASSIVTLWNLMIVNNWSVFLRAYSFATGTNWAWLYFIVWWLVSVIIILNVYLTLVIEVCVTHWENFHKEMRKRHTGKRGGYLWRILLPTGHLEPCSSVIHGNKIYDILREELEEPPEDNLMKEVYEHGGITEKCTLIG